MPETVLMLIFHEDKTKSVFLFSLCILYINIQYMYMDVSVALRPRIRGKLTRKIRQPSNGTRTKTNYTRWAYWKWRFHYYSPCAS